MSRINCSTHVNCFVQSTNDNGTQRVVVIILEQTSHNGSLRWYRVKQKPRHWLLSTRFGRIVLPNADRLPSYFFARLIGKFSVEYSLMTPPRLNRVAALPCEIFVIFLVHSSNGSVFCVTLYVGLYGQIDRLMSRCPVLKKRNVISHSGSRGVTGGEWRVRMRMRRVRRWLRSINISEKLAVGCDIAAAVNHTQQVPDHVT